MIPQSHMEKTMNIEQIADTLQNHSIPEIMTKNLQQYLNTDETDYSVLQKLFAENEYNAITQPISYFEDSIADMQAHWENYLWLYETLADEQSKTVLTNMLAAKLTMDTTYIEKAFSPDPLYFDREIWGSLGREVYLDCGAYEGDSILKFICACPWYGKIYAFEAMPDVMQRCKNVLSAFSDGSIVFHQKAVSDRFQTLLFDPGSQHGESCVSDHGSIPVEAVTLDSLEKEKISFIKMDIEGSELAAIAGAEKLIRNNTPKMAICIYHKVDDFWKIPQEILRINKNYRFKIRQHDYEVYSETVLYCLPNVSHPEDNPVSVTDGMYHRLYSAVQNLACYSPQENENLLQHGFDKKWFLKQLTALAQDNKSKQVYIQDLMDAKIWLEDQIVFKDGRIRELEDWSQQQEQGAAQQKAELATCQTRISELENWSAELEKGKSWLEEQVTLKDGRIRELEDWSQQQEQGAAQQKAELDTCQARISELENWSVELEKGKAWLEDQVAFKDAHIQELDKRKVYLEDQISSCDTQIRELKMQNWRYSEILKVLKSDPFIRKIIRIKKYKVDEG